MESSWETKFCNGFCVPDLVIKTFTQSETIVENTRRYLNPFCPGFMSEVHLVFRYLAWSPDSRGYLGWWPSDWAQVVHHLTVSNIFFFLDPGT